jgi:DNA-binding NarL/FixJ family response regulator
MIRVAVVDGQSLMRTGIVACLAEVAGITVVGEGGTVADIAVSGPEPDVVVASGNDLASIDLAAIRVWWPTAAVVLYVSSSAGLHGYQEALRDGAAIVAREAAASELLTAVREGAAGRSHVTLGPADAPVLEVADRDRTLTPRECDVLRVVADGRSNRDIAQQLRISEHTVKTHLHHAMRKLQADSRAAAVHRAALDALI